MSLRRIKHPFLHIVLFQPEIPANTGNIARLCAAAEMRLHLIHPLGFRTDDRHLKRAGLDYWPEVDIRHHASLPAFMEYWDQRGALLAFSRHARAPYTEAQVYRGDGLVFGSESTGLPQDLMALLPCFRIPMWGRVRSLNLATSVGIVAYHFLHSLGRF